MIFRFLFIVSLWSCIAQDTAGSQGGNVHILAENGAEYRLKIPPPFIRGKSKDRSIEIRTLFPSMKWLTPRNRSKFFNPNGSMTDDVLRIFLSLDYAPVNRGTTFTNRNDRGKFELENWLKKQDYNKTNILNSEKTNTTIDLYSRVISNGVDERYVIQVGDRITVISCAFTKSCKAKSTIRGIIGVEYYFGRKFMDIVFIVESSVHNLLSRFTPHLVE